MPSIAQIEDMVIRLYPTSHQWRDKVHKMADDQIIAIYLRHQKMGTFDKQNIKVPQTVTVNKPVQMSLFTNLLERRR